MVQSFLQEKLGFPRIGSVSEATELVREVNEVLRQISTIDRRKVLMIRETLNEIKNIKGSPEELRDVVEVARLITSLTPEQIKEFNSLTRRLERLTKNLPAGLGEFLKEVKEG